MKRGHFAEVAAVCLLAAFLCACGGDAGKEEKTEYLRIGVACYNQSDTFIGELTECFKDKVKEAAGDGTKAEILMRDAVGSQRTQNDQVEEMIEAGCNVLCVNLVDRTEPSDIIDMARDGDIPVIFFNRAPVAEDLMQWDRLYYVGADAKQAGRMQGELAADAIREGAQADRNNDGKIQYVVLEGEAGHQDSIVRTESAIEALRDHGIRLEKIACPIANWDRAQAENRMTQLISQFQNKIELVLTNNDDMALGAIDAYGKSYSTESALPIFIGIDGTKEGLAAVADGRLAGTVYNDKEGQAEAMARVAVAAFSGEGMEDVEFTGERSILLPHEKVTADNVASFMRRDF